MASTQGMCQNCGSLIIFNDKEELCECIFCDCVFPSQKAIEIAQNPKDYEPFPNEPQPKRDGQKRFNVAPIYPDVVSKAVENQKKVEQVQEKKTDTFEVSPDDIKAPKKVVIATIGISLAFVVLVAGIGLPFYISRKQSHSAISSSIHQVFDQVGFTVNSNIEEGYSIGFSIIGQRSNQLRVVTDDELTTEDALATFEAYAELRAQEYGYDRNDFNRYYGDLRVEIVSAHAKYIIRVNEHTSIVPDIVSVYSYETAEDS